MSSTCPLSRMAVVQDMDTAAHVDSVCCHDGCGPSGATCCESGGSCPSGYTCCTKDCAPA
ncbi:6762_t:CDS:2, partial [Ambispora leptoticha]